MTRLLVDLNRSPRHPQLFSEFSRPLPLQVRQWLLDEYYAPHDSRLRAAVQDGLGSGSSVVHVAVHSFTPRLGGVARRAEVGLLYDPARPLERRLCDVWRRRWVERCPEWRIRRNYPYLGIADGVPTRLRRAFDAGRYVGVELELNQALFPERRREVTRETIRTLREALQLAL